MSNFRIGEIAIAISLFTGSRADVELLKFEKNLRSFDKLGFIDAWLVLNLDDGKKYHVRHENLRKRHEPGKWEDLKDEMGRPIWNPMITAGEG